MSGKSWYQSTGKRIQINSAQNSEQKHRLTETSAVNAVLDGYSNNQLGDAAVKLLAFDAMTRTLDSALPEVSVNLTTMRRSLNKPSQVNNIKVPPVMLPDVGCKL